MFSLKYCDGNLTLRMPGYIYLHSHLRGCYTDAISLVGSTQLNRVVEINSEYDKKKTLK